MTRSGPVQRADPGVVHRHLRRADRRAGAGVVGHRRRRQHAGHRADRVRQDAGGVPVGDRPPRRREPDRAGAGTRVLYVSPLKALAVDVERNLRTPLTGITRIAERRGLPAPDISVGVRSGDTPPARPSRADHQAARHPDHHARVAVSDADVGGARNAGRGADRDRRRGARRRRRPSAARTWRCRWSGSTSCWSTPAQRIGLSATVRPPEEVARFLSGQAPTTIVAPPAAKTFDLSVQVPVPDMANLENNTIWPDVEARIVDLIEAHRSSIVFANSRRLAERLTSRLNEIHAERGRASNCRRRPTRRWAAARRRTSWAAGQTYGADAAAGARPPRLGQQGAARPGRRRPQDADGSRPSSPPRAWNWASTWARSTW